MSANLENVLSGALALPSGDRIELVEAILASLQPVDRPPLDEGWRETIARRSSELETGAVTGVPWSEVKSKGRGRMGG